MILLMCSRFFYFFFFLFCFYVLVLCGCFVLGLCGVVSGVLSSFAIIFLKKLFLIVFLLSCDCQCSVSLPRGAVVWSLVRYMIVALLIFII